MRCDAHGGKDRDNRIDELTGNDQLILDFWQSSLIQEIKEDVPRPTVGDQDQRRTLGGTVAYRLGYSTWI